MVRTVPQCVLVLVLVDIAAALVVNYTANDKDDELMVLANRRHVGTPQKGRSRSTSSDEQRVVSGGGGSGGTSESLEQSITMSSSGTDDKGPRKKKDRAPKSSAGRKGWRKWHRKCTQCPEDMHKKWRSPSIKWICGAYQRARRSFKSLCMMHYRNCQDGTMFTKIADHRCPNSSPKVRPFGDHFFYDYEVILTDESEKSDDDDGSSDDESSGSSWDTSRIEKLPPSPPEGL